ncbi:MAG: hypothetical protein N3D18_03365 [Roseococcus sp.]|nr:hypothetical protein [Roseococcus sp.]
MRFATLPTDLALTVRDVLLMGGRTPRGQQGRAARVITRTSLYHFRGISHIFGIMPRTLAIIGTSNSIRGLGYRPLLERALRGWDIRMMSLGATTGVLVPYMLAAADLSDVDAVIVDVNVNDSVHVASRSLSPDVANALLVEGLCYIRDSGAAPLLLLMPNNHPLKTGGEHSGRRLARQRAAAAQALGCSVVDGFAIADGLAAQGVSQAELFDDVAHAGLLVSASIAQEIARWLSGLPEGRQRPEAPPPCPFLRWYPPLPAEHLVERASSLISVRYRRLVEEDSLEVGFGEVVTMLGVAVNHRASAGLLTITAEHGGSSALNLSGRLESDDPRVSLMHVVHQLPEGLEGRSFTVRLERPRPSVGPVSAELEALVAFRGRRAGLTRRWREELAMHDAPRPEPTPPWRGAGQELLGLVVQGQELRRANGRVRRQLRRTLADDARYRAGDHALLRRNLVELGLAMGEVAAVNQFVTQLAADAADERERRQLKALIQSRLGAGAAPPAEREE